jgi:hypothetical protein
MAMKARTRSSTARRGGAVKRHAPGSTGLITVYDGRLAIGALQHAGSGKVTAFKIDAQNRRKKVGAFPSRSAALRELYIAVPSGDAK